MSQALSLVNGSRITAASWNVVTQSAIVPGSPLMGDRVRSAGGSVATARNGSAQ